MSQAYANLMNLPSSYGIRSVVQQWQNLSENIDRFPTGLPLILPDLFLVADYGVGRTHVLRLLADYLSSQKNLMDFYGDVKYFEFLLRYCKPGEPFAELPRLIQTVSDAAGFRSEYRGIVSIDVNEWLGHCEEKHFLDLLEYLADNSDHWLIVFTVPNADENDLRTMEAVLSMFLRIEKAVLSLPSPDELLRYVSKKLYMYNILLSDDAGELLAASIARLRSSKYFDGLKTLDILVRDIAYRMYASTVYKPHEVTAEELFDFAEDGEYIRTRIQKDEKKKSRTIGFTGGNNE